MDKYDVSLVLPCYNENEIFNDSVSRIIKTLSQTDYTWEIIFIEDKSRDNTAALITKVLEKNPRLNLSAVFHQCNLGRGKTVVDGFNKAQGKYVGFMDIDLETGEWYLPKFIDTLEAGADVALAWRIYDFQLWSLPRWIGSKGYIWLRIQLLGLPYRDTESGYKFFRRNKILPILKKIKNKGWFFDTEIMALCYRHKLKTVEIPVAFVRNKHKTSTVRLIPDTLKYLWNLIKFSWKFRYANKK
ncbi:MAG: glycosyltransferase family 2 protein [bacterium]|nr:glycosyltransferase family 2 protein [bacterium]